MDEQRIGLAAGAVWSYLHEEDRESATVSALKKISGFTGDEITAGIGWLAREEKIEFETQGKKICVCLVQTEMCV